MPNSTRIRGGKVVVHRYGDGFLSIETWVDCWPLGRRCVVIHGDVGGLLAMEMWVDCCLPVSGNGLLSTGVWGVGYHPQGYQ